MTAVKALAAQTLAALALLAALAAGLLPAGLPLLALAAAQGALAALVAAALRAAPWWLAIHLAFAPLAVLAAQLPVAPAWYLAGFALLALVFWSGAGAQVPLYLSNRATAEALAALLPAAPGGRVIDLGGGTGGLLARLAAARPDLAFTGIESAPLPYLAGRLGAGRRGNVAWRRGDFWREPLAGYDLAYAFLSPVPMARLWAKACAEMRSGALLVSNSFAVPGVEPAATRQLGDRRRTRLYLYRIPARAELDANRPAIRAIAAGVAGP